MEEKFIANNPNLGLFLLRLSMGILFIYGGVGKFLSIDGFSGLLWGMVWLAYLVAITELVAGLLLVVGIFSRFASLSLIIVMIAAILIAHNPITSSGQLMEALIRLTIIGGLANIMLSGPGDMLNLGKKL